MISGHCECGRVRFAIDGEIEDFSHCHCSQCRRMHGAAYATFAGVARKNFRFMSGENDISEYVSSDKYARVFCSQCGSNILAAPEREPDVFYVSMGAIDGDPPRPAGYHIYVGSKAPWHEITDDLPQHETEPGQWP